LFIVVVVDKQSSLGIMVKDPNLVAHLAHFGVDVGALQKVIDIVDVVVSDVDR
jgi:hypothetical protein